jgi:hypothetical protein
MSTTTRLAALREQIQSACHLQGLTLMAAEKSSWWGRVNPPPQTKQQRRSQERLRRRWLEQSGSPEMLTGQLGRDIEVSKMTLSILG